ncbi:MAG TPA: hypothetical protein VN253_25060 [Kofleriaceae bacterium]|nr:hypothetical protein [Kofleriaceae bacterium]
MTDDVLSQLVGASPRRLLEDLARIGAALAKNDRPRPEVECFLASGQLIRGRVVSVAEDRQGAIALLAVGGNARAPSVAYVRVDQIAAITVVDASLLVKAPVVDSPIPSKLELQRQLAVRADTLAGVIGKQLAIQLGGASELDDDGRRAIGATLPLVAEVLAAIAADDMGKDALRKLETIELGAASSGDVGTYDNGQKLVIRAPKLLTEQYTVATLRRAIEKLL